MEDVHATQSKDIWRHSCSKMSNNTVKHVMKQNGRTNANLAWFVYKIKQAIVTFLIRIIICTIRGCAPQAWPTKYKHGIVHARNLEMSCNFFGSVTNIRPYESTHPAPPMPRVLDAVYWAGMVKPVHKSTIPSKHHTWNTNRQVNWN